MLSVASSARLIAVAINDSVVQCMWKSVVIDCYAAKQYTIFSCSDRLQDGLCHVSLALTLSGCLSLGLPLQLLLYAQSTLCLGKNVTRFICDNLVRCRPILPIVGRNIPQGI